VEKGQLLVAIDKTQSLSDVDQVRALLASAEADKEHAIINFNRQKQLFERKLISQAEFDLTKNALDRAVQMVNQYRASLERAKDQLNKCTIRAPIDGTITQLISKVGENVLIGTMNNAGTVIMVISDLSEIVVKADVDETDIAQLGIGQPVKISLDAFPDTTFVGKVTEIGNAAKASAFGVQDQVTNFVVTILITDKVSGIKPGMNASVDITTNTRDDALKIPIQAVVMRSPGDTLKTLKAKTLADAPSADEAAPKSSKAKKTDSSDEIDGVFIVDKQTARFVPVKTGISDQQYIEITSGLSDGQKIITGSYKTLRTLRHGDKIKAKERSILDAKEQSSS
jgi:HlyD family secretion protein